MEMPDVRLTKEPFKPLAYPYQQYDRYCSVSSWTCVKLWPFSPLLRSRNIPYTELDRIRFNFCNITGTGTGTGTGTTL